MDELDRRLLELLRVDARLSMAELGRRIGLSRTATLARVRHLEDRGVIRGYHADVRNAASGASHTARVGINVDTDDMAGYVRRLASFPELREAETVTGELDLIVRFAAPDAARLEVILDRMNAWPETVRTMTFVVLTRYVETG